MSDTFEGHLVFTGVLGSSGSVEGLVDELEKIERRFSFHKKN